MTSRVIAGVLCVAVAAPAASAAASGPPAALVAPHLDAGGDRGPVVGVPVSLGTGVWSGSPTDHRFGWERCAPGTLRCAPIPDATGRVRVPVPEDVGWALRGRVWATGPGGTGSAVTATTSPVAAAAAGPHPASPGPGGAGSPGSATGADGSMGRPGSEAGAGPGGPRVRRRATVGYGATLRLAGRVPGSPARHAEDVVRLRDPAGVEVAVSALRPDGTFVLRATATLPGTWIVETSAGGRASVAVRLRPVVRLTTATAVVAAPGVVRLRGFLVPGVPGKTVELQYLDPSRGWRLWRHARTGANGSFAVARVLPRNPRAPRYTLRVRAAVPADRGWPFTPAVSPTREVRVG